MIGGLLASARGFAWETRGATDAGDHRGYGASVPFLLGGARFGPTGNERFSPDRILLSIWGRAKGPALCRTLAASQRVLLSLQMYARHLQSVDFLPR